MGIFCPIFVKYSVSLRIQSEYRKLRTKKAPNTDTFHTVIAVTDKALTQGVNFIYNCIN